MGPLNTLGNIKVTIYRNSILEAIQFLNSNCYLDFQNCKKTNFAYLSKMILAA